MLQPTKLQKASSRNNWLEPVRWKNGVLEAVDCTSLPGRLRYIRLGTVDQVCNAIRTMKVRGAPLIQTRPTGVNLRWAVERVYKASSRAGSSRYIEGEMRREADAIMQEELE